ncbi:hypothetical protein Q5P01_000324 [Channa striata]|uniref:Uncharacterized protein n=1 Tax=Channa striata TaxID=64152 RepID=A0AA88IK68_CHASR|nr:hypothetical protein Q5P01_000324 [Channa striata]
MLALRLDGPCSPLCTSRAPASLTEARTVTTGRRGLGEPRRPWPEGRAEVLHGSVTRKTERFWRVTTSGVFATSPGPELRSPTAPLDVRRCDVMLLQVPVWTREPPGSGEDDRHVRIPVRYSSAGGGSSDGVDVYVERTAEETLRAVARQGWGSEVGVSLGPRVPEVARHAGTRTSRDHLAGRAGSRSSHGAFLDLDTIGVFRRSEAGCGRTAAQPGRWKVGRYDPVEPYAIRLPREELRPERTGLSVFEELCWRSNNRAGIVGHAALARHAAQRTVSRRRCSTGTPRKGRLHSSRVYSVTLKLAAIASDMASGGFSVLAVTSTTRSGARPTPFFTELAASRPPRPNTDLYYRYFEERRFGTRGPPRRVDGLYKLHEGMFFQRWTTAPPPQFRKEYAKPRQSILTGSRVTVKVDREDDHVVAFVDRAGKGSALSRRDAAERRQDRGRAPDRQVAAIERCDGRAHKRGEEEKEKETQRENAVWRRVGRIEHQRPPFASSRTGFYRTKTKVLASRREAAKGLGLLAETIARDLARLYCSDRRSSDRVEANFVLSEAVGCVVSATESLALLDNGVSEMDAAIGSNEEETRRSLQVVSIESRRCFALCSTAQRTIRINHSDSLDHGVPGVRDGLARYRGYTKLE